MTIFLRLLRYARSYTRTLLGALALSWLGVAIELARPWPVKVAVDYALAGKPLPASLRSVATVLPGAGNRTGILVWSALAAVVFVVLGAAISLWVLYLTVDVSRRLVVDLSSDVLARLQRLSLAYHARNPVGDLIQRVASDVFVAFYAVSQVAFPLLASTLTLGGMFLIMARLDLVLALLALAVVPALVVAFVAFARPIDRSTAHQWDRQGALMALVEQSLYGIKAIQGFARETYVQRKLEASALELSQAYNKAIRISGAYGQSTALITGLGSAALLGVGGVRVIDGRLTVGDLLVFLGYLTALYAPVTALSTAVGYAVATVARGRRVFAILDSDEEVPEAPGAVDLGRARGDVVFEGVSFCYRPGEPVLNDVSFRARAGQVIAVVGVTGAGKSSLVSLISRFYDPADGRVLVDGHDVRDLTLKSLRENVALVLQDPFLFPITIRENIAFGKPDATFEEVERAAHMARAHDFIERLPDGYDTVLAEKGGSLSGGERQRISIARAIVRDAPILVLDEPTSSLDARTETEIFDAITDLIRSRTTFVVSHRLSTIRRADQIVVLEGGRIVERGSHDDLVGKGDLYARLYRLQVRAALDPSLEREAAAT